MIRIALLFAGLVALIGASGLAGCTDAGDLKTPWTTEAPFVATAVPADFAVVVDENHDTFYARQHIRQMISVANSLSTTQYSTLRDYSTTTTDNFSQETPLSGVQLQNMWNDVARYNLLNRSTLWVNWLSNADLYKRDAYTVQIRANGQTRTYRETNGFPKVLRPLILQVQAVRLPVSQDSTTPVVKGHDETPVAPAPAPAEATTASMPAATIPAATEPAK